VAEYMSHMIMSEFFLCPMLLLVTHAGYSGDDQRLTLLPPHDVSVL
jgi:hypothetical protein